MEKTIEKKTIEGYLLHAQELKKSHQQEQLLSFIDEQIALNHENSELESFFKGEHAFYSGHYERSLMLYMQARSLDLFEFFCYRATAFVSSAKGNPRKAQDFVEKALIMIPEDPACQQLQEKLSSSEPTQNEVQNSPSFDSLVVHKTPEAATPLLPKPELDESLSQEDELDILINAFHSSQREHIHNYLENFLTRSTARDNALWVFNGWKEEPKSSILPLIPPKASGGFYFRWNGQGIVINPDEHFLNHFIEEGIHCRQIHSVLATHFSPSIQAGIEHIYALNSQLNEISSEHHLIHYYLNLNAYQKLAHKLKPRFKQEQNTVHSLGVLYDPSEMENTLISETISLTYRTPSTDEDSSLALTFHLKKGQETLKLGYIPATSRLIPMTESLDFAVIHVGSEIHSLIKAVANIKSPFVLLTGFEGKQGDLRLEMVRRLRKEQITESMAILPADCGMIIDLQTKQIKCSLSEEMLEPLALQVVKTKGAFSRLHYLSPANLL